MRVLQPFLGEHRLDELFDDGFVERGLHLGGALALVRAVLGGKHHGVDAVRLAVDIAHGHLAFGIGAQKWQAAVLAQLRLALDQTVSVFDPRLTIVDNFRTLNPDIDTNACRAALARFRFRADAALQKAGTLSGGELLRAALAATIGGARFE